MDNSEAIITDEGVLKSASQEVVPGAEAAGLVNVADRQAGYLRTGVVIIFKKN